jgi:hypothetical protein
LYALIVVRREENSQNNPAGGQINWQINWHQATSFPHPVMHSMSSVAAPWRFVALVAITPVELEGECGVVKNAVGVHGFAVIFQ